MKAGTEFEESDKIEIEIGYNSIKGHWLVHEYFANKHYEFFEPIPDTPKNKVPKTVWDLEWEDTYYSITDRWDVRLEKIAGRFSADDIVYRLQRDSWNAFLTKEDAAIELSYRKAKTAILKHHAENSGFVADWKNKEQRKHSVYFNMEDGIPKPIDIWDSVFLSLCFFASDEEAQQSIKDCEKEWKIIFNIK